MPMRSVLAAIGIGSTSTAPEEIVLESSAEIGTGRMSRLDARVRHSII